MKLNDLYEAAVVGAGWPLVGMMINGAAVNSDTHTRVWTGDFNCRNKNLRSLSGAPKEVTGGFTCARELDDHFHPNELTSLEGAPRIVGKFFSCFGNMLINLKGAPDEVGGYFECAQNKLMTLEGITPKIGDHLDFHNNELTSLKDIHKQVKQMTGPIIVYSNPIKSHVLGVLYIKGCQKIIFDDSHNNFGPTLNANLEKLEMIMNKFLPNTNGHEGVLKCKFALQDAGLEEYAKL
jgi:hypothetical protein